MILSLNVASPSLTQDASTHDDLQASHISSSDEHYQLLRRRARRPIGVGWTGPQRVNATLVTTAYSVMGRRGIELDAALVANLDVFQAVHVLHEGNTSATIAFKVRIAEFPQLASAPDHTLLASPRAAQPTYRELIEYAAALNGPVVIANSDVVFDTTLGVCARALFANRMLAYVFPTSMPATPRYEALTGARPCFTPSLCWAWGDKSNPVHWWQPGWSYDGMMFMAPLTMTELSAALDKLSPKLTQNTESSETHAAAALRRANRLLRNPCLFVRTEHWHCLGEKRHRVIHVSEKAEYSAHIGGVVKYCSTPDECGFRGPCTPDDPCAYGRDAAHGLWVHNRKGANSVIGGATHSIKGRK